MFNHSKNNLPTYALIYTRISSKSQKADGSGDASQEVRCKEYAKHKGYIYENTFEDVFTGGGNFLNRKGIVELLTHIDNNKDRQFVVIFDDLKRFARDVKFHISLREELANRNAKVDCPNFRFDDSAEGEANELYTAVSNQLERKQNQRQVIQKQTARLQDGYWPFHAPKGYSMIKVSGYGKKLFPNPQADIIKQALEGFAQKIFLRKIDVAYFLKEKGVLGKQQPEKYLDTVSSILSNVVYAGYIEYPKRGIERREGKHDGLISLTIYETIQKRLKRPHTKRVRRDLREDFPVRGLINCGVCTTKITGGLTTSRNKTYPYYNCCKASCEMRGKTIHPKTIEEEFEELLKEKEVSEDLKDYTQALYIDAWAKELEEAIVNDKNYKQQIKAHEEEIDTLLEQVYLATSTILKEQYEKRIERLGKKIKELEAEINNEEQNLCIPFRNALDKVFGHLKSPYLTWKNWNLHQKHLLFEFLFDTRPDYIKGEGFRNVKMSYGIRVLQENKGVKKGNVDIPRNSSKQLKAFIQEWYYRLP